MLSQIQFLPSSTTRAEGGFLDAVRPIEPPEHERVQRGRRQHEAQCPKARRNLFRQPLRPVGIEEDDRRRRAAEQPLFVAVDRAIAADDLDVGGHQRERLPLAPLRAPQASFRLCPPLG